MTNGAERNAPCPCGSGRKYKRCCLGRDARSLTQTERRWSGDRHATDNGLTLIVETPTGVARRRIPNASPLHTDAEQGLAAEDAVQDAASIWGLPDFVYRPTLRSRNSGVRELGDGILLVGRLGIVVQVKSRVSLRTDIEKERNWLVKQIGRATRQGAGTIRSLREERAELQNARGRTITVNGNEHRWLTVVVIDHPCPPEGIQTGDLDTVVLLRRDWEFLFDQLKSTHAVATYLERVAGEPIDLGEEPVRYYECAQADARAPAEVLDDALVQGARTVSAALLPLEPAASSDRASHLLVRSIFEDIATSPMDQSDERLRLHVLAELDRLPIAYRGDFGRFMLQALAVASSAKEGETLWRFRMLRGPAGHVHLGFGAGSGLTAAHRAAFSWWVQLRHHQLQQITNEAELTTVGVLLTPRPDRDPPWDTTMMAASGDLELTDEELADYRYLWDNQDTGAG